MYIVPEVFKIGTYIGLWRPTHWKSTLSKQLYKVYMYFSFSQIIILLLTQLIFSIFSTKTIDDFNEASFFLITTMNVTVKAVVFIKNRTWVLRLIAKLMDKTFMPQNDDEKKICLKVNTMLRSLVALCAIFTESVVFTIIFRPLVFRKNAVELPLKAWFPIDIKSGWRYQLLYIYQSISILLIPLYDLTTNIVFLGVMVYTGVQLDFLVCRLQNLCKQSSIAIENNVSKKEIQLFETKIISECVQHHIEIYAYANQVNETFSTVILFQFLSSSTVLGITGYLLVMKTSLGFEIVYLVMYMFGMLLELFLFSWFGTEITLKSLNLSLVICEIDLIVLNIKTIKEILILMIRSTSPIFFSCGPLINLSIDTFTKIVKVSYSAVNVMKSVN